MRDQQFTHSGSSGKRAKKTHINSDSEALLNRKEKVRAAAVCVKECDRWRRNEAKKKKEK